MFEVHVKLFHAGEEKACHFEQVDFKQRAKAWGEASLEQTGGCGGAFRAEGIACEVALRQGMALSVPGTELDPWLRPGEQRGDP